MKPSHWTLFISIGLNILGLLCIIGLLDREASHRWVQGLRERISRTCGRGI